MKTEGAFRINGYEIVAVIPSMFTRTNGQVDTWYLVGQASNGDAVVATTYDLAERSHWASGDYFMQVSEPGGAVERALRHALHKAGADIPER